MRQIPTAQNSSYAKAASGADNKFHYREWIDYLTHTKGKPDLIVNNPETERLL